MSNTSSNDGLRVYYNKRRREFQQEEANKRAWADTFKPRAEVLSELKSALFDDLTAVAKRTEELIRNNLGHDNWLEDFENSEFEVVEEWIEDFSRSGGIQSFAKGFTPRNPTSSSCRDKAVGSITSDNFNWFVFWDAQDEAQLRELADGYRAAHKEIRCAACSFRDGAYDGPKGPTVTYTSSKQPFEQGGGSGATKGWGKLEVMETSEDYDR